MRTYIFDFEQSHLVQKNINLQQALILDYIQRFMQSDKAYIKNINNKPYIWIRYSKVISDLPILNIKKRMFQLLIQDLESKNVIQRVIDNDKCLIHVNKYELYSHSTIECENYLTDVDKQALIHIGGETKTGVCDNDPQTDYTHSGNFVHPIVNYYKNKIKIIINDKRVPQINGNRFLISLKSALQHTLSPMAYDICIKNMEVLNLSDYLIVLSSQATTILKQNTNGKFEEAVNDVLTLLLSELPTTAVS